MYQSQTDTASPDIGAVYFLSRRVFTNPRRLLFNKTVMTARKDEHYAEVVQVVERETETQVVNSKVTVVGSNPTLCTSGVEEQMYRIPSDK